MVWFAHGLSLTHALYIGVTPALILFVFNHHRHPGTLGPIVDDFVVVLILYSSL